MTKKEKKEKIRMTPREHFLYYEIIFGSPSAFAISTHDKP